MNSDRKIFKYKNYRLINNFLKLYSLKSFNNKNKVKKYVNFFELDKIIFQFKNEKDKKSKLPDYLKDVKKNSAIISYNFNDLSRLHWLVLSRKALNILEIGSGYSTVIFADACDILSSYFKKSQELRLEKKFHVYSLEESKKFLNITKKRIPKNCSKYVSLILAKHKIIYYKGKYASKCLNVPNISPDFVYLDGPSQYFQKKNFEGFNFNSIARFPMSADLLMLEYFFEPGTVIIIDGRTSNARFLKHHFKRKWKYIHDEKGDIHFFELNEKPLGVYNKKKIKFCLNK